MTTVDYQQLLQRVDSVLGSRVLVYGSLPPDARDLDLLVRPDEAVAIARALREDGFVTSNRMFVAFRGCTVLVVEVIPAARLSLPAAELDALYDEAVALGRLANVAEPSPHHSLLILARRLAAERVLQAKHRARIDRAVASDPEAWRRAEDRASEWSAQRGLERLRSLYEGLGVGVRWRLPRPRPTRVIALTGRDADRTRLHAASLCDGLARLGFEALIVEPVEPQGHRPFDALGGTLSVWRPVLRQLGRGTVLIYDVSQLPPSLAGGKLTRLAPRPLYLSVIDPSRPREEVCEELAARAWHALVHRSRLSIAARRLVQLARQRLSRAGSD